MKAAFGVASDDEKLSRLRQVKESDAQLAEVLSREGVKVARRTVAKYREALGLASSSERRHATARANA